MGEDRRSLFLFLAVLPLLNALFDVVSYAVTLTLVRRGLRAALPFLWGLADLAVACVLLLGLGATLVAVIHGLNTWPGCRSSICPRSSRACGPSRGRMSGST